MIRKIKIQKPKMPISLNNCDDAINEILDYEKLAYEKINPLKSKRENLWRKHKKARIDDEKKNIENQIVEISKKITPLAEEIKHCDNIRLRLEKIKKFEIHQKLEQQKKISKNQIIKSKKLITDLYR